MSKDSKDSWEQRVWQWDIDRYERAKAALVQHGEILTHRHAEYWMNTIFTFLQKYPQFKEF